MMANFRYKAMTANGAIVKGVLEAPSQVAAVQEIRRKGHYPISAQFDRPESFGSLLSGLLVRERKVPLRQVCAATQELSVLLSSGLELDRALGILCSLKEIGGLKDAFASARTRVRDGMMLADALGRERAFPRFYISMVRAGEMGGDLAATFQRLADYLKRRLQIRETLLSALIYPAVLMVTAGLSVIVILTFVLPQFEPLFAEAGRELPLPTRVVLFISDAFRHFWWLLALIGLAAFLYGRHALAQPHTRARADEQLLRLPVIGALLAEIEVERLCRSLGVMLKNGVALPDALRYATEILSNRVLVNATQKAAISLRQGDSLAHLLGTSKYFPSATLDIIRIGEETGRLEDMLLRQADLDEQRVKQKLDRLMALLVPVLTILLGIVVAGLIASMLVAILSVNDLALQ